MSTRRLKIELALEVRTWSIMHKATRAPIISVYERSYLISSVVKGL